jgi:phosphoribosyl 1,2-cyclic phosphodiesterase
LRDIPAKLIIKELPNTAFTIGDFVISSEYISHPGPTVGYRIQSRSKTICYLPDHEPVIGKSHLFPDDEWVSGFQLANHADLLIHDSQYDKVEYMKKVGWGHCSLDMAAEFCSRTEAKRLVMFHHDPLHSDDDRTRMFENFMRAADYNFQIELAVQGQEIEV